ncbi:GPI transamidase component PIG-T-like isoform X2 [Prunus avium]|uniref:GPI transamidase component PIG-T-like isoform X2 n=1 Tax=Prunus avium TaxID=42229 RepID=A0A6P5SKV2_PRUAV|nr:GPI transamidase component PIG-T-like isoform X2 [Prunus avium]
MALPLLLLLLLLRRVLLLSLLLFAPILHSKAALGTVTEENFSEEMLLKPLPGRKVLAHFNFRSRASHTNSSGRPHRLFPKAISQLVQKFHVKEMEFSFTQGHWNYDRWGGFDRISSNNAKPPGVELWAVFDVTLEQVDDSWKNLIHALSGLFCASINFLDSSTSYSAPEWGYRPAPGSLRVLKELNGFEQKNPSVLYEFSMEKYSESRPFDLGLSWKLFVVWSCQKAPLHASRFLMGSGNGRGAFAISLRSTEVSDELLHTDISEGKCKLEVKVFQVVPWYIKVYFHTLRVYVNEQPQEVSVIVEKMLVSPSVNKMSPGVMEMVLKFPCGMKSATITLEFDKGFLHIDEYPPDANQGFDIPSAIISFPNFHTSMQFFKDKSVKKSSLLSKFLENSDVLTYTEVLLVLLATPDFSMPCQVMVITVNLTSGNEARDEL